MQRWSHPPTAESARPFQATRESRFLFVHGRITDHATPTPHTSDDEPARARHRWRQPLHGIPDQVQRWLLPHESCGISPSGSDDRPVAAAQNGHYKTLSKQPSFSQKPTRKYVCWLKKTADNLFKNRRQKILTCKYFHLES